MADEPVAIEVHMKGSASRPIRISLQLDAELATILHRPPYATFSSVLGPTNFHIYLFKDTRGGKSHSGSGSLTLLRNVALHFLQEYGEQPDGRPPLKNFHIGGRRVKFSLGRGKPRQDVVERIQRFPYVDPIAAKERKAAHRSFKATV
ncbi:hypothetical protein B0H17DRAFT_1143084 [Mycena rosella]|uniref:Uncharacterized protein n=1 Tax=Mycena rosella TaxID=1033263 RepID=A0AAD7CVQ5_MYCRO|nr:hypothetical protein B0H17DRAFT_1143084 [Mycena rosella]